MTQDHSIDDILDSLGKLLNEGQSVNDDHLPERQQVDLYDDLVQQSGAISELPETLHLGDFPPLPDAMIAPPADKIAPARRVRRMRLTESMMITPRMAEATPPAPAPQSEIAPSDLSEVAELQSPPQSAANAEVSTDEQVLAQVEARIEHLTQRLTDEIMARLERDVPKLVEKLVRQQMDKQKQLLSGHNGN